MLIRLLTTALLATVSFSASAQAVREPFQAGTHYQLIDPPQPTASGDDIEVIEVFSYACGACAVFEPQVQRWKQQQPAGTRFSLVPAQFSPVWEMFARAYYTAEALGVAAKAHQEVFDGVHVRRELRTLEDVAKVYAKHGISAEAFLAASKSFGVNAKLNRAKQMVPRYQVEGTPTLVVAGKYRISTESAGSHARMFEIVDFLVAKEKAARQAPAPAPVAER
jgi:thiol:disulfide interchange protein DsbA